MLAARIRPLAQDPLAGLAPVGHEERRHSGLNCVAQLSRLERAR
jgi:hypothetical protein